ncbi:UDP-N-acetylglucosamine, MurG, LPS N-acetylglucosamine transferase [Acidianus hospitalis W1]|jgi:UDP-N-acetylglucosamine:LPS N-acetylglucosamine transferase|uniref:UDP-N-acetylglucosamine, MurG, LPS N-acetylglucosamine transferase n=1 Tax=Acidianus hospitalis (strain W1) TaxID=933801 RepID=F4B563_ACIHW|nr:glycosyltransferase [Acidianus hospitalis]AEE94365.1 UDP-N-acetylglucosamine, MurG, LPS N-acetylglucosamine transferase [Acidianus hospitalis W1]
MSDILIIASGGGHTGFARAIAEYLPYKADFIIPKGDEMSKKMISQFADKIYEVEKFRSPSGNLSLSSFLLSMIHSAKIRKYKKVIATGSNHSIFPSFFQFVKSSNIYVIESQDRIVTKGKAVNIISKYSKHVFLHWKEQEKLYKNGIVVGPIVERPKYTPSDEGYILVTTGSEGFERLFDILYSLDIDNVVLQTGKVNKKYEKKGWKVFSFDPDIERYIAKAKLVITHQGKTAMEAVVMYKKPTIIVYNKDWKYAATFEDSKLYAEILGTVFLNDPSNWSTKDEILKYIENPKQPKVYTPGTERLVSVVLNDI